MSCGGFGANIPGRQLTSTPQPGNESLFGTGIQKHICFVTFVAVVFILNLLS